VCGQADGTARAQSTLRKDLDAETTLDRAGLSLSSVPEDGERVQVKSVINDIEVEDNVGVLRKIDESTKHICVEAAAALGTRLVGVDLITTDVSAPLVEIGGVILEVNTAPGLFHHQHTDVHSLAARILDRCLARSVD
jgi:cyanophycin synthetase